MNYGYAKHAVHLVKITAPKDLKAGAPVVLAAKASWLVCSDVCIPEDADLQLKLPVSGQAGAVDPADGALFTAARSELPSAQLAADHRPNSGRPIGDLRSASEWGATLSQITSLAFFPYDEGGIEYAAPQTLTADKDARRARHEARLSAAEGRSHSRRAGGDRAERQATDTVPMEIAADFSARRQPRPSGNALRAGDRRNEPDIRCRFCCCLPCWAA